MIFEDVVLLSAWLWQEVPDLEVSGHPPQDPHHAHGHLFRLRQAGSVHMFSGVYEIFMTRAICKNICNIYVMYVFTFKRKMWNDNLKSPEVQKKGHWWCSNRLNHIGSWRDVCPFLNYFKLTTCLLRWSRVRWHCIWSFTLARRSPVHTAINCSNIKVRITCSHSIAINCSTV